MKKQPRQTLKNPKRLPYEPPEVVSEQVFETQALSCGKQGAACIPGPDFS